MNRSLYAAIALIFLLAVGLACGSSNTGTQIGINAPAAAATVPQIQVYHIGDVIQVESHTIVLNEAQIVNGNLQANFTVENKGTSDMTVSSMLSFEAKNSDGTKLDQEIFDCPSGQLDGKVLPGDKLKGNVCWKGAAAGVRIYYTASLFGSGAVVWDTGK